MALERRDFFKFGLSKVTGMAVDEAEQRANKSASRWIRPPYAVAELDFLIKCTRCDDCVDACPHDVLFKLPAKFGIQAVATPAMDLLNKGCHMCSDWPCVNACAADALVLPEQEASTDETTGDVPPDETAGEAAALVEPVLPPPRMAKAFIDTANCLPYLGPECGACEGSCPVPNALLWDGPKPKIDLSVCTGCAMCREACIVDPKAVLIKTLSSDLRAND